MLRTSIPKWVLVADDDDLVRQLWTEALSEAGYRTVEARTGREAIDLMRTVAPDLMILDLRMPDLTGGAVLQSIQARPVLHRIPVLIISGFLEDEPAVDLKLNIVARLAKPISLARLREVVASALAHPPTDGQHRSAYP
jgi:CheY-like chemotaxis protein